MTRVGIVGAGAAAAALAYVVDGARPGAEVTVLEKSGGLCGRAATRHHGELTYDYGANYLKSEDERVNELVGEVLGTAGLVDATEPIYTFDRDGAVTPGRDADDRKWSYAAGLTQIGTRLFGGTDATVRRHTRVETLRRADGAWRVVDADGSEWGAVRRARVEPACPADCSVAPNGRVGRRAPRGAPRRRRERRLPLGLDRRPPVRLRDRPAVLRARQH